MKFIKRLLAFVKFAVIGVIWSYIYLCCTVFLFKSAWDFNYLSRTSWSIISTFWQEGGKIKSGSDYLFIICLLLLIPLWLWGWKKLCRINWVQVIMMPISWNESRKAQKYLKSMSRIKLHNIGASVGAEIKKDFENKLKKQQEDIENSPKASQAIRSQIKSRLADKQ